MTFHIITIFPNIFDSYFNESIIKRAQDKKLIKIKTYNLRDWSTDKHKTVDDTPFGGGPGMLMQVQPLRDAIADARASHRGKPYVVYMSPHGVRLDQQG